MISSYHIEAKTGVYVNACAIGRYPEFYENPDEFLPERFMNSSIAFIGQHFKLISDANRSRRDISMGSNAHINVKCLMHACVFQNISVVVW